MDVKLVGRKRVMPGESLAERVDRRGTDVAEDNADGADGQLVQRPVGVALPVRDVGRSLCLGASSGGDVHVVVIRLARLRLGREA